MGGEWPVSSTCVACPHALRDAWPAQLTFVACSRLCVSMVGLRSYVDGAALGQCDFFPSPFPAPGLRARGSFWSVGDVTRRPGMGRLFCSLGVFAWVVAVGGR